MPVQKPLAFAFVSVDDIGRPKAADRKLIRSHCMAGKNVKAQSRRQVARAKSSNKKTPERKGLPKELEQGGGPDNTVPLISTPPDLLLAKFAGEVDSVGRELLFKYYSDAKKAVYPYELYVDFDYSRTNWFTWLYQDPAYLHSALLAASAYEDYSLKRPFSHKTYRFMRKTLQCLREQVSNPAGFVADSTIIVVLGLALAGEVLGDKSAVSTHLDGLQRIVRLRGGLEAFRYDTKLYMKLSRIDLAQCLSTGEPSPFLPQPVSWGAVFDSKPLTPESLSPGTPGSPGMVSVDTIVESRLATCFHDLHCFAAIVNAATPTHRIPSTAFQEIVGSIQYRLMALQGESTDFLAESLRLGMLAFLTTTYQMPGYGVRYPDLARRFRLSCQAVETTPELRDLVRWLLVVGAISVCDPDESWLRDRWRLDALERPESWQGTRSSLREIMWIDAIHDQAGESAYNVLSSPSAHPNRHC